jgi:hypothetical protein
MQLDLAVVVLELAVAVLELVVTVLPGYRSVLMPLPRCATPGVLV